MAKENSFTENLSGKVSYRMKKEFEKLIDSMEISQGLGLRMAVRFFMSYMDERIKNLREINPTAKASDIIKLYSHKTQNYLFMDFRKMISELPVEEKIDFIFEAEIIRSKKIKSKEEINRLVKQNLL